MKKFLFLFAFILPVSIIAQGWDQVYPADSTTFGFGISIGFEVALTDEGGYLLAGETDLATGAIRHYARLLKTDQLGNVIWQHTYDEGDVTNEEVHFVKELSNQEIILGSSKNGLPRLVKIDNLGAMIWEKNYESDTSHIVTTGIICPDGNYLMSGYSGFGPAAKLFLLKFDLEGDLIWSKYHTFLGGVTPTAVSATDDDGFIVTGILNSKVALIKLDSDGDLEWDKSYEFSTFDNSFAVKQTSDGGYIAGGMATGIIGNLPLLFKTDSLGNGEWTKFLTGNAVHQISDIILEADGGYVAVGAMSSFWNFSQNGFIIQLDEEGEEVWSQNFDAQNQQITSVKHTPDNGYILAGTVSQSMLLKKIGGTTSAQKNINLDSAIEVFPNPMISQTTFSLKNTTLKNVSLSVFDVMGKMVRQETQLDSSFIFHKKNLASGIYFYQIKNGNILLGNGKLIIAEN